jgi:2-phosphosulfolactate phosphatase
LVGAGAILNALPGRASPEAQLAIAAFGDFAGNLLDRLMSCSSGRELSERGFGHDVELAAQLDFSAVAPILKGDEFAPPATTEI